MITKLYVGVDPGLSGALAILDQDGEIQYLKDMPVRKDVSKNTVDILELSQDEELFDLLLKYPLTVAIERVNAMPGQGVASMFAFGKATGKIEGFWEAHKAVPTLVMPTVWKRSFSLLKQDKKMAVYKARELWPDFEKSFIVSKDGRADACLIAKWLLEKA